MRREFPEQADVWPDSLSRRHFLTLMGASLALAGLGGCSVKPAPLSKIVPYVHPPRDIVPGQPLFFATTMAVCRVRRRPARRKPHGPADQDRGKSRSPGEPRGDEHLPPGVDPDAVRSRSLAKRHLSRPHADLERGARARSAAHSRESVPRGARGVRILSEPILSPSLAQAREAFAKAMPQAKWHVYEPVHRDSHLQGTRLAFGEDLNCYYDFRKADVVLSLDEDFLSCRPGHLRSVADFIVPAARADDGAAGEPGADESAVRGGDGRHQHRREGRPSARPSRARDRGLRPSRRHETGNLRQRQRSQIRTTSGPRRLPRIFEQHRGRCLIVAGERQPPVVHLLAHALNHRLGNIGQTVFFTDPIEHQPAERTASLRELVQDMQQGRVELLVVLAANPGLHRAGRISISPSTSNACRCACTSACYQDETARYCHWHLPEAHYLEAWGDARTYDGTASICQPLIEPLYGGRSVLEIATFLATLQETPGEEIVRKHWRDHWTGEKKKPAGEFSEFWKTSLHDGLVRDTALPAKSVQLQGQLAATPATPTPPVPPQPAPASASGADGFELVFQPDPTVYDGSFANNGWLQELPKPLTTLTWDNAAIMSPATAKELGVGFGDYAHGGEHGGYHMPLVDLNLDGRTVRAPVWIMPGHAERSITVYLGYGREFAGRVGGMPQGRRFNNEVIQDSWGLVRGSQSALVGFNAYRLRTSERPWFAPNLRVTKTDETYLLACTQAHQLMENRDLVRSATLTGYQQKPDFASEPLREHEREDTRRAAALPWTSISRTTTTRRRRNGGW